MNAAARTSGKREPLPPGSFPGWGASHWLAEQPAPSGEPGLSLLDVWRDLTIQQRANFTMGPDGYSAAVRGGWWPDVPGEEYVDSYHPFASDSRHPELTNRETLRRIRHARRRRDGDQG